MINRQQGDAPLPQDEMRRTEHIDLQGHLHVPVEKAYWPAAESRTPKRDDWEPFFVNINLSHPMQKVVIYRRAA